MTEELSAAVDRPRIEASWLTPLKALLRADTAAQLRSYRALALTLVLPLIVLVVTSSGKRAAQFGSPDIRVGLALTVGMVSIGAIAYSTATAQDRDRGVFQRLRVTPAPTWTIMGSRWIVQAVAVLLMSVVVLVVAGVVQGVQLSADGYVLTLMVALLGGAVFLSIGQAIVGLIPSAETLNAAGRLLYLPLIFLSLFGHTNALGTPIELISRWSPGGCVETLLSAAMGASAWSGEAWGALLASAAYVLVFAGVGIRWFRWAGR